MRSSLYYRPIASEEDQAFVPLLLRWYQTHHYSMNLPYFSTCRTSPSMDDGLRLRDPGLKEKENEWIGPRLSMSITLSVLKGTECCRLDLNIERESYGRNPCRDESSTAAYIVQLASIELCADIEMNIMQEAVGSYHSSNIRL